MKEFIEITLTVLGSALFVITVFAMWAMSL